MGGVNTLYDVARYKMLTGALNWTTQPLILALITGAPDFVAGDTALSDITGRGHTAWQSFTITVQTVAADGTAQTNAVLVPAAPPGTMISWMVISAAGTLVLYVDDAQGLPFATNGLDMVIQPDWSLNRGWFRP
jgi:hypothetical protein